MTHNIRTSKSKAINRVLTMFVFLLAVAYAGQVHASCTGSDRINHGDADCLSASWNNHSNWRGDSRWKVKNNCSSKGTVVAKIDFEDTSSETVTLYNGSSKSGMAGEKDIENIYCCADLGDLCNKSDG